MAAADQPCPGSCENIPTPPIKCPSSGDEILPGPWLRCDQTNYYCCAPKSTPGGTTTGSNNKGFGFDKVKNVATSAGYSPNEVTLDQRISNIVSIFLSLLGVLFMILMIYGGYTWMTAAGDEKKIDKAKDIIRAAIIGLIIVVAAYAISVFVISKLWGTTTTITPTS